MTRPNVRPGDLKVDGLVNPLSIDEPKPTLSWRILEPADALQTAYRVEVASSMASLTTGDPDLWDSGRVEGRSSIGVVYGGSPLASRDRCYWRVTAWDEAGGSSQSDPAQWEMGLLEAADWRGEWLAAESEDERAERELTPGWFGDVPGPAVFRFNFDATRSTEARLLVGTDSVITAVSCDGVEGEVAVWHEFAFGSPPAARYTFPVEAGRHTIAVRTERHPNPLFKQTIAISGQLRLTTDVSVAHQTVDRWETATPGGDDWTEAGRVTGRPFLAPPASAARLLRREFDLPPTLRSARLYVAALGGYEIAINGDRVGLDELQSEPTEYAEFVPYRAYDVTAQLNAGANAIGITVADGFFASYAAPVGRYSFGPPPRRVRAMLAIDGEDGSTEWIVTDEDWRCAPSPITSSEIYNGEVVDFRLDQPGWDRPGFDDARWSPCWKAPEPAGRTVAPLAPPIRAKERVAPASVVEKEGGRFIVDFGQNFAGRIHLRARGASGQQVTVRHAEVLDADGELDVRNLRAAAATDRYILRDDAETTLAPRFVYHGFRFAEIAGLPALSAAEVQGVVLTSSLDETGHLEIDAPVVQRLWLNTLWSQRSNFVGVPTDCPQRDERLGWTGDAQIFWDTAAYNMDVAAFARSYCREMRAAQAHTGAFPVWAPKGLFAHPVNLAATPGWADAGVELPYVAFLHSGDRMVVDENWAAMTRYLDGVLALNPDGIWRNARGADFGDHLSLDSVAFGPPSTPQDLIGTAMLARDLDRMVAMARWTGRSDDANRWLGLRQRVGSAFAAEFIDADGMVGNGSHASYILALRICLVPDEMREQVGRRLVQAILDRGTLLTTGFLGTPLALDALADIGESELAYTLLLRTEYPSWGYMVEHGATTIWERWDGDTGDVSMNSFNHYALGAVCAFLYRRVCGIEALEPGFSRIRIAPLPDRRVPSARASYDSAMGTIVSGWRWARDQVDYEITVPPNATAELVLPGRAAEAVAGLGYDPANGSTSGIVGPGTYRVTATPVPTTSAS